MSKIGFLTDSCSDIPQELADKYGIEVVGFPINLDGVEYMERKDFTNDQFYQMMRDAQGVPTTSQPGHGLGVRSICAIVEQYGGIYSFARQQDQFVSDASHELRTPIAVIQGYVNMLDRWGKEDETVLAEAIEAIQNEADHMQKLVEQLLFLARGDANRQTRDMKEQKLDNILEEIYEEACMIEESHSYVLEKKEEAVVWGDYDMLKQSLRILVDNAVKYTPGGGEIILRVGRTGEGKPYYEIQDSGIGMSQQDAEHAFDRFYRADSVRSSKSGGTGLGLSIARWIMDKHGADCRVLSVEGLGTRFHVEFPLYCKGAEP